MKMAEKYSLLTHVDICNEWANMQGFRVILSAPSRRTGENYFLCSVVDVMQVGEEEH